MRNSDPGNGAQRGAQLAVIDGRSTHDASKFDLKQARQELASEPDPDPKEADFESAPESETRGLSWPEARTEQANRPG